MFKRILVSLDDCTASEFIVGYVHGLSRWLGCRVTLLHVLGHKPDSLQAAQQAFLEANTLLERLAHGARVPPRLRLEWQEGQAGDSGDSGESSQAAESVAGVILRVAALEGTDLIVMGTHAGADPLVRKLGSVSQAVAARSRVPVQLIPLGPLEPRGYAARLSQSLDTSKLSTAVLDVSPR